MRLSQSAGKLALFSAIVVLPLCSVVTTPAQAATIHPTTFGATPEPGGIGLLVGAGTVGLGIFLRRRKSLGAVPQK